MSGARIALHLALELQRRGGGVGAAALCGGGGQGDALVLRVPASRADRGGTGAGRRRRSSRVPATATPRSVARLISLVEDASPLLREAMAALAPYGGQRRRHRAHRRARASASRRPPTRWSRPTARRASGSACWPSTRRRRSPAARCSVTGCGCRTTPSTADVYIRSMASRGHLGGLAWSTPQALRVLDAAGCDVVLVETVGVGQSEVEVAGTGRHHGGAARAGHGRRDPGREGRHPRGRRRLRRQQGRPGRRRQRRCASCGTCSPGGAPGAGRVAAADRQDGRLAR